MYVLRFQRYSDSHWVYGFIFLETASILSLGVCIETAIWRIGLHFLGNVYILYISCKCVYIDFNRVGIATGRISLLYCYIMIIVTEHISTFTDCTCIEIVTEQTS